MVAREIFVAMTTRENIYDSTIQKHLKIQILYNETCGANKSFSPMIVGKVSVAMATM